MTFRKGQSVCSSPFSDSSVTDRSPETEKRKLDAIEREHIEHITLLKQTLSHFSIIIRALSRFHAFSST